MSDSKQNIVESALAAGRDGAKISDRIAFTDATGIRSSIPVAIGPNGQLTPLLDVLKLADERADRPRRLRGTATHTELESFIAHVNRFKVSNSVVYADVAAVKLTAVFNYHGPSVDEVVGGQAQWGDHRSVYVCPLSREWKLWTDAATRPFSQVEFGEFIENHFVDIVSPTKDESADIVSATKLLEVARTLTVLQRGEFSRSINPTTGESTLVNKTEHDQASTKIPRAWLLGIPVFEAGELYRIECRMRFAMVEGRPRFAFVLTQPETVLRDAFNAVRGQVLKECQLPVFAGSPE